MGESRTPFTSSRDRVRDMGGWVGRRELPAGGGAWGRMDQITEAAAVSVSTRNPVRRLYNWVLHWAHTPYGTPALFVLAFVESSFFPVPPDVLLMALALSRREKAWWYAAVCSVG